MPDYYKEEEEEEILTVENCKELTNFDLYYFIRLTGIYGLHQDYEIIDEDFEAILRNKIKVTISIRTNLIEELTRTFFLNKPIIQNNLMIARQKGKNIGLHLLSTQVNNAMNDKFKKLIVYAYREKKDNIKEEEFNGYWLWGRYGFIMDLPDRARFIHYIQDHIKDLDIPDKQNITLYQLLSDQEGSTIWYKVGESWDGTFYLSKNSDSNLILEQVLQNKNLKSR